MIDSPIIRLDYFSSQTLSNASTVTPQTAPLQSFSLILSKLLTVHLTALAARILLAPSILSSNASSREEGFEGQTLPPNHAQ
jgi:hypothetical protein